MSDMIDWWLLVRCLAGAFVFAAIIGFLYELATEVQRRRARQRGVVVLQFTSRDGGRTWTFREDAKPLQGSPLTDALQDCATDLYRQYRIGTTSVRRCYRESHDA